MSLKIAPNGGDTSPKHCKVCGCGLTPAMILKWYEFCSQNCYSDWYGDDGRE